MHAHVLFLFLSFVGGVERRGRAPIAISNVIMIVNGTHHPLASN